MERESSAIQGPDIPGSRLPESGVPESGVPESGMEPASTVPGQPRGAASGSGQLPPYGKTVLIVNTRSRRGQKRFQLSKCALERCGLKPDETFDLDDPERLPEIVHHSVQEGARLIVVGGGDGSLRCAAGPLAYQNTALGILPFGTVNDLARNLRIPSDLDAACAILARGHTIRIDLARANDEYFILTASVGFSARMQNSLSPRLKKMLGPFGYVAAGLAALPGLRNFRIQYRAAEETAELGVLQAGVITAPCWMGGAIRIPEVSLEDGQMLFYALQPSSDSEYFRIAIRLLRREFLHTPDLHPFTTRDLTIETPTPQPLVLDGDLCGSTPARLTVPQGALRVCVARDNASG
jgi:diacylglycerol kinase (ATP)